MLVTFLLLQKYHAYLPESRKHAVAVECKASHDPSDRCFQLATHLSFIGSEHSLSQTWECSTYVGVL
jgi:hypothetical protein